MNYQLISYGLQHVDATDNSHAPFHLRPGRPLTLGVELPEDPSAGWEDDDLGTERFTLPPFEEEDEEPTLLGPESIVFELTRVVAIAPAPVMPITNVSRVHHRDDMTCFIEGPAYPRIMLAGDWT